MRWLRLLCGAVGLLGLVLAAVLSWTHSGIRKAGSPLPTLDEIRALPVPSGVPVGIFAVDTASQVMDRSLVLDPAEDPAPSAPYVMSHPAFLLRWRDGRGLLVDLGMDPDAARAFGRPMEWLGADPIRPVRSATEQLGSRLGSGPLALVFSHLHPDHTQGVAALCSAVGSREIVLFQTPAQATLANYTTLPARRQLDNAACLERRLLPAEPLAAVAGFPGVHVLHAAGHTPGSQVVIARVRDGGHTRTLVFTGDVVNQVDGARSDASKPFWYRLLVTPESDARLGEVRHLLGALEREQGAELVVAHDRLHLETLGLLPPSSASSQWPRALLVRGEPDDGAAIARDALERILSTRIGARAREILDSGSLPGPVTIALNARGDNLTRYRVPGREPSETIDFDPSMLPTLDTDRGRLAATPETVLAHELGHALFKLRSEDAVILEIENPLREELGLPLRRSF